MIPPLVDLGRFWGKTGPSLEGEPDWHPCLYHCLDVVAAGEVLLKDNPAPLSALALALDCPCDQAERLMLQLLFLHDIGKLSRPFQAKSEAHWPAVLGAWSSSITDRHGHAALTDKALRAAWAAKRLPWAKAWRSAAFEALIAPFAGHHGRPVRYDPSNEMPGETPLSDPAIEAMLGIAERLFPLPAMTSPDRRKVRKVSWHLAGWVVLSDWLGSNRDFFPFQSPDQPAESYFEQARLRATSAMACAGLARVAVSTVPSDRIVLNVGYQPTATQRWANEVELGEGPHLAIIEDITGSGKTEAAIMLAHRMMQARKASGIYIALPTMATANAMFNRMADSYASLFEAAVPPSIALAHGARALSDRFSEIKVEGLRTASLLDDRLDDQDDDRDDRDDGNGSAATCVAWLADSTRKTFLAQMAVGTIDQALLSVLPGKYQSLRMHGLAQRVLIIDEAHAYDAYMMRELERLLAFHRHLGGSAIILSATLPKRVRHRLQTAFAQAGDRVATEMDAGPDLYPLMTLQGINSARYHPSEPRNELCRRLFVDRLSHVDEAIEAISSAAELGQAVAWVRNSVDDAIEAFGALSERGLDVGLFHARMALGHRLATEQQCLEEFGKDSQDRQRRGRVLVATQVIEQSLDLDFDVMVSDLAPVDLLLQRAGRVCRHERGLRAAPRLMVVSPDPGSDIGEDWVTRLFPRVGKIYEHHTLLWRTAREIFAQQSWRIPEELRGLIERVYAETMDDVPPDLLENYHAAEGKRSAEKSTADFNLLKIADGYSLDGKTEWRSDVRIPTRLGEPTTTLRLARLDNDMIVPLIEDDDVRRAWALSEVRVRSSWIKDGEVIERRLKPAVANAKSTWTRFDELKCLIVLGAGGLDVELREMADQSRFSYSTSKGLTKNEK